MSPSEAPAPSSCPWRSILYLALCALVLAGATMHAATPPHPIIFVHGINSDDRMWDYLVQNLETRYGCPTHGTADAQRLSA